MAHHLSERERLDWLQLIRTPSIGPITFRRLLAKCGSAGDALKALPDLSRNAGRRAPLRIADRGRAEAEIVEADRRGAKLIAACEPDYPRALAAIPDHPPLLYVRGAPSLFEKPAAAIIGARNASAAGRKIARTMAADLGAAGIVVVSGLARGIDGAAHEASLKTGAIAVVAGGVDVVYPPEHAELTERLAKEGAVVSERPMGYRPTARDFPKRNRLIAGLSRGVVVVEAATKSGTLITARFANDQGREVFAVPGSPLDPRYDGAIHLIREGATAVRNAADVLDALAAQMRGINDSGRDPFDWTDAPEPAAPDPAAAEALRAKILDLLSFAPLHRDDIIREADAPPGLTADALLDLVLSGEAEEHPGGRFSRAAGDDD